MKFTRLASAAVVSALVVACGGGGGSPVLTTDLVPPTGGNFDPYADYGLFLNVLTPGQADCPFGEPGGTGGCDPQYSDQLAMYENLVFAANYPEPFNLRDQDLVGTPDDPAFFKTSAFVAPDGTPPSDTEFVDEGETVSDDSHSALIRRDSFGVPYIYGDSRPDVMFGTGYASAADRMFLMDALRHVGRGRQSDFIGGPPAGTDVDLAIQAAYDEQELWDQGQQLAPRFGRDGAQALEDVGHYVAGINQYISEIRNTPNMPSEYVALNITLRDFTPRDVVAIATLVQAIFAVGGGSEHKQVLLLREIEKQVAAAGGTRAEACELWRDLRHFDDPEKPTTADDRFETQSPPTVDETVCPLSSTFATAFPGAVLFDEGSYLARTNPAHPHPSLVVVECALGGPLVACPDRGGSPVDDPVDEGDTAMAPASIGLTLLAFLGLEDSQRPAIVPPWKGTPRELLSPAEIAQARDRAIKTTEGLQLALAGGMDFPAAMSNALLVNGSQTTSGYPIAVFGPQTGYFAPQLLLELNQQGGDINVRGMTFAGLPYVVIGRGVDFAWSATSSGDDIIDIRVLRLCNMDGSAPTPASVAYVYNNECTPMYQRTDQWTAEYNAAAPPDAPGDGLGKRVTRKVLRAPHYGPVFASATVAGQPVALAVQRSTFFGEVDSALPFVRISRNEMYDPASFYETFNTLTGTFNWFYIDAENISYFNSGLLPIRADGVHPDLPSWGDGTVDWQQTDTGRLNPDWTVGNFLPLEAHPRQTNPSKGYMTSWNNAQAPGFWAAEHQASYGPVHRSDMLDARLVAFANAGQKHTPATMVTIMEDAGTTDLRAQEVLPAVFDVLASPGPALTAEQQTAVDLLKAWVIAGKRNLGGHRRDADAGDGAADARQDPSAYRYSHRAATVLMDFWWEEMFGAALPQIQALADLDGDGLGPLTGDEDPADDSVMLETSHDAPGPVGSAFISGYYGYARRVFDMALDRAANPYRQLKCAGTGTLAACRAALLTSLDEALVVLGTDPASWAGDESGGDAVEVRDAIHHDAVGVAGVPDIHWVNRPTWQQVVQPTGRRQPAP